MVAAQADPVAAVAATPPPSRRELSPAEAARRGKVVASLGEPNVIAEDGPALERMFYGVAEAFRPRNRWQDWLAARIATLMTRIDRSERVERKLREWASYRAFDFWEDDQRLAVAELAGKLAGRSPARAAAKLRAIPAGVDWLTARWRSLAQLAPDAWEDGHRSLAAQLLGGDDSVDPAVPGFAAARVAELEGGRACVEEADALLRGMVESDLSDAHVPDLAKLRRQVREWQRQLKWCADQFHVEHPDRWDDPMRRPAHEQATPDGFREVDSNHFEGSRPLQPLTPPPAAPAPPQPPRAEAKPIQADRAVDQTNRIAAAAPARRDETDRPGASLAFAIGVTRPDLAGRSPFGGATAGYRPGPGPA